MNVEVKIANYSDKTQGEEIAFLLNAYAIDAMGGGAPLEQSVIENLSLELGKLPNAFSVLGYVDRKPAGLVNCFTGFSTFACKPLINIHDVIVLKEFRGKGLCRNMLDKVEEIAIQKGCCKLTLEVLSGNEPAQSAYRKFGFSAFQLDPNAGEAKFLEKSLTG